NVGVGVEAGHAFGGFNPAFGRSVLFEVNERIGTLRGDNVAGEDDLLFGQVDDQVAAGVCGGPMQEGEVDAVDLHRFFILGDQLVGDVIGGRRAAAAARQCCFLLLLIVLLRDHSDAFREGCDSVDMVAVAVGEDNGGYRLGRDLGDFGQQ